MHNATGSKSTIKLFGNIFISFIGAGMLGLPYAFSEAGVLEGAIIMSCIGLISIKAMFMIVDCKYKILKDYYHHSAPGPPSVTSQDTPLPQGHSRPKHPSANHISRNLTTSSSSSSSDDSIDVGVIEPLMEISNGDVKNNLQQPHKELDYGDVGYYAVGSIGRNLVDFTIVISQIGFCCAYLIFISENLHFYVPRLEPHHWLLFLLPPLGLLALVRNLSNFAVFSLFADFANVFAYSVVFYFDFEHASRIEIHPKAMNMDGLAFFLGIAIYSYEGAGMILALEASSHPDIRYKFKSTFKTAMFIVTGLYISFGICGYLSFGPETHNIITLNLPQAVFPVIVKCCLCFSLFFTYPVMLFPAIRIIENRWSTDLKQGVFLRVVVVCLSGAIVVAIPNFSTLMALVGSTCCTLLAFILPALFHWKLFKESLSNFDLGFDLFLIVIGLVGAFIGTKDALSRLFPAPVLSNVISDSVVNTNSSNSLASVNP